MDLITEKWKLLESVRKYRYVLIVLLAGIFLMALPSEKQETSIPREEPELSAKLALQDALSQVLSKVSGAGKVEVLLTENAGEEIIYQSDESRSTGEHGGDIRRNTILVTDEDRREVGLIKRTDPPSYQGAIILCQGADDARVKLALVEAVANATGLTSDKITVLKMN